MQNLIILSFDATTAADVETLKGMPNFSRLAKESKLLLGTSSVFLSNTYPAHASVITGCYPGRHGLVENLFPQEGVEEKTWRSRCENIKVTTLYDEARKAGLTVCSLLWPTTAGANIRYNMPEVMAKKGENQVLISLREGSKLFQISMFLRYRALLKGYGQPWLDDFVLASAMRVIKAKKPHLTLIHFTDVDSHKHKFGPASKEARAALMRLDERLGALREAAPDAAFIIFGDHGMLPVEKSTGIEKAELPGGFFHAAGGTAFFMLTESEKREEALLDIENMVKSGAYGIKRRLNDEEMRMSGLDAEFLCGVEAMEGMCFDKSAYKGQHGYSLRQDGYTTFILAHAKGIEKGEEQGGCIIDICPMAARILGLPLWPMDART